MGKKIIAFIAVLVVLIIGIKSIGAAEVHAATENETVQTGYYYDYLSTDAKSVYKAIVKACESGEDTFEFNPVKDNYYLDALDAARYDHPEYYWLHYGNSWYWNNSDGLTYKSEIPIPADADGIMSKIDSVTDKVVADAKKYGKNEYQQYEWFYDYILDHTYYEHDGYKTDQDITGVFISGKAVCAGYANAFKYLCDKAGLFCITVSGNQHAWNMIRLDGSYYWVDVTWSDNERTTRYASTDEFKYFCATDDCFLKSHTVSANMQSSRADHFRAEYPACTNDRYTIFSLKDIQFQTAESSFEYIQNNISWYVQSITVQFDSNVELHRAINILFDNRVIWDLVNATGVGFGNSSYWWDDDFNTLIIEFYP